MGDGIPRRVSKSCCSRQSRLSWLDQLKSRLLAVSARREQEGRGALTLSLTTPPPPRSRRIVSRRNPADLEGDRRQGAFDSSALCRKQVSATREEILYHHPGTPTQTQISRWESHSAVFLSRPNVGKQVRRVPSFLARVDPPVRQRGGSSGSSSCIQVFSCHVRESITRVIYIY
jgi:hypothetical protein